jgi:hypothetical protein
LIISHPDEEAPPEETVVETPSYSDDYDHNAGVQGPTTDYLNAQF